MVMSTDFNKTSKAIMANKVSLAEGLKRDVREPSSSSSRHFYLTRVKNTETNAMLSGLL